MEATTVLFAAVLFLCTGVQVVTPKSVPIKTYLVPKTVTEGETATFVCTFNVTQGKEACKPTMLQLVQINIFDLGAPSVVLASFDNLLVDDYRLHVSLDTAADAWVYTLNMECTTRRNYTYAIGCGGFWNCKGIHQQSCVGDHIAVHFAPTDAFPVCPSSKGRGPASTKTQGTLGYVLNETTPSGDEPELKNLCNYKNHDIRID